MDSPTTGTSSPAPPPPPPPFGVGRPRQLRRRPDEGPIAGVCAGVAEYFDVDVMIVRIAAVVLAFTGPGVLAYLLAWIFVPAAGGEAHVPVRHGAGRHDRGAQIFGIILLAVAVSILWGGWWSPARRWIFPLGLIVLGGWLILRRDNGRDDGDGEVEPPPHEPAPWSAATPAVSEPAGGDDDTTATDAPETGDATLIASTDDVTLEPGAVGDVTAEQPFAGPPPPAPEAGGGQPPWDHGRSWHRGHHHPRPPRPPRPPLTDEERAARRRRRMVFPTVMGALLLWAGIAFLAGASLQTGLAVALCIVGVGFVLGAFVGGSRGLIIPAFVLAAALVFTSVVDIPLEGPIGSRTWAPDVVERIDDHYEMSVGEGILDLTQLDLGGEDEIEVRATVGIGHLVVRVPDDVGLDIRAESSVGEVKILGEPDNGLGVATDRRIGVEAYPTTLVLDLEVGVGQVEVVSEAADRATTTSSPDLTTSSTLG